MMDCARPRPGLGLLREGGAHDRVELLGQLRPPLADARRGLGRVRVEHGGIRAAREDDVAVRQWKSVAANE